MPGGKGQTAVGCAQGMCAHQPGCGNAWLLARCIAWCCPTLQPKLGTRPLQRLPRGAGAEGRCARADPALPAAAIQAARGRHAAGCVLLSLAGLVCARLYGGGGGWGMRAGWRGWLG